MPKISRVQATDGKCEAAQQNEDHINGRLLYVHRRNMALGAQTQYSPVQQV